jgi:hypothetical protein
MRMRNRHPVSDTKPPEQTLPFWRALRELIVGLWSQFGGPKDIAALGVMPRKDYIFLGALLRGLECIARHVLSIDAAAVRLEPLHSRRKSRAAPRVMEEPEDCEKPETWRASFRLIPRTGAGSRTSSNEPQRFPKAMPLARRFEAVLRVFDAPEVYARRLARYLHKNKQKLRLLLRKPNLPLWTGVAMSDELRPLSEKAWKSLAPNSS